MTWKKVDRGERVVHVFYSVYIHILRKERIYMHAYIEEGGKMRLQQLVGVSWPNETQRPL